MAETFRFHTRMSIRELTGLRAVNLTQLLKHVKSVGKSVIFHHTHSYLQHHQEESAGAPNDFAHWSAHTLGDKHLGESLAAINITEIPTLEAVRERLVEVIEEHLRQKPASRLRFVNPEDAFHFVQATTVTMPTPYEARDLLSFLGGVKAVTTGSIYFHMYEAKLHLDKGANDFSVWFDQIGEPDLANAVAQLDPYTCTLSELQETIIRLVSERIGAQQ